MTMKSNLIVVKNLSSHQKPFICWSWFEYSFNSSYKKVFYFLLILHLALLLYDFRWNAIVSCPVHGVKSFPDSLWLSTLHARHENDLPKLGTSHPDGENEMFGILMLYKWSSWVCNTGTIITAFINTNYGDRAHNH